MPLFGTPLFARYAEVTVGVPGNVPVGPTSALGWTARSGSLDAAGWKFGHTIAFTIHATNDAETDDSTIEIYNIGTIAKVKVGIGSPVVVRAGYIAYFDTIFTGAISAFEIERVGADEVFRLICQAVNVEKLQVILPSMTVQQGTYVSDKAREAYQIAGVPIGEVPPKRGYVPTRTRLTGVVIPAGKTLDQVLDIMVANIKGLRSGGETYGAASFEEGEWKHAIEGGRGYFVPKSYALPSASSTTGSGYTPGLILSPRTGLISAQPHTPTEGENYDLKFTSLLIPMLHTDMIVKIYSPRLFSLRQLISVQVNELYGWEHYMPWEFYKITKLDFISDGTRHVAEAECVKANAEEVDSATGGGAGG